MEKESRKPEWLKVKSFTGVNFEHINRLLRVNQINTVCQAANCPNRGECYNRGTAAFLILGPTCTRNCRFCNISTGVPANVDPEEPRRVAEAVDSLNLNYAVITSVTRDDLPDGGAQQFVKTVNLIREKISEVTIEVLTPDFKNKPDARNIISRCNPDVFNHNIESVPRLYTVVRPRADYQSSLKLLKFVSYNSTAAIKSGLMVGMGETFAELKTLFKDLAKNNVSILTIGQYLSPSKNHLPVNRYLLPDEFVQLKKTAEQAGIKYVLSAPLVRSSYKADSIQ